MFVPLDSFGVPGKKIYPKRKLDANLQPMTAPRPTSFATTRWTMVREAAQGGDTLAMEAQGTLFGTYLRGKGSGDSYVLPGGQHPP